MKLISVNAKASSPSHEVSIARTISEPAGVQKVIALIEDLRSRMGPEYKCPKYRGGLLVTELRFRKSAETPPVATLVAHAACPYRVKFSVLGQEQPELSHGYEVGPLLERLLGIELWFPRALRRARGSAAAGHRRAHTPVPDVQPSLPHARALTVGAGPVSTALRCLISLVRRPQIAQTGRLVADRPPLGVSRSSIPGSSRRRRPRNGPSQQPPA